MKQIEQPRKITRIYTAEEFKEILGIPENETIWELTDEFEGEDNDKHVVYITTEIKNENKGDN